MATTNFNKTNVHKKEYIINHYRHKKIKDKHLITTDHGAWIALDDKEFKNLLRYEIDDVLFKSLEGKGIIITKNNIDAIVNSLRNRFLFLYNGPTLHIIIPTLRCNSKCVYCHSAAVNSDKKRCDMTEETAEKTLEFTFQSKSDHINIEFQGGESLLNFELFKFIVKKAREMNKEHKKKLTFLLVTNLTLMNYEILEFIRDNDIFITTSLDGPENIHNKNRMYENKKPTYNNVVYWIDKLKPNLGALMVATKHSLPFYKEIIDEYVKWGFGFIQLKRLNKLGFANSKWKEIGYSAEEFVDFWKKGMDYIIKLNKKGVKIKERYADLILRKVLAGYEPGFLDFRNPCGLVNGQLAYNFNGDIYCCDEGRDCEMFRLGNVKNSSMKEIINSKNGRLLLNSAINDNYLCDNCVYKPYCNICPVLSYAEDKNIITNLSKNRKCKILKAEFDYIFNKILFDKESKDVLFNWLLTSL